jgi:hypothetical protein
VAVAGHAALAAAAGVGGGDCCGPPRQSHRTTSTTSSGEPELSARRRFEAPKEEAPSIEVQVATVCTPKCRWRR